ncbi:MAG: hypothetical protein C5S49_03160 [Candidatus Methanogaster sp.]|nr:MAG: hypothetical protein C5S49_03160 [ANME-2 cluster archaeon]
MKAMVNKSEKYVAVPMREGSLVMRRVNWSERLLGG